MARIIQVLLPLVCVVIAEAQIHIPFFDFGLHPVRPISDGAIDDRPSHHNSWHSGNTWLQHYGNPDSHRFSSGSHERVNSYEDYDPFYHGDPYYHDNWDNMPGINNVFNIPSTGHTHKHLPSHKGNKPDQNQKHDHNGDLNVEKPEENPKKVPAHDEKPTDEKHDVNNMKDAHIQDIRNISETSPPKTNPIKKEDDKGNKDDKSVGVDKKKDFLLVGQGGNGGNNVFLLHENTPNPNTVVPPINQPGSNIIYVPYNPGQPNQVYQVVNGQPAPSATNLTPDKIGVSTGYNTVPSNVVQPTANTGTQNPGYVTIYSNGQLIQIPGVVVNPAQNNAPTLTDNQGTQYIIANAVPNNVQTVPAASNPQTPNVIYATLPNQPSNGPIYIQMPNCMQALPNGCSGTVVQNPVEGGNNGLPSNVVFYQPNSNTVSQPAVYPNGVSNGYVQPNVVTSPAQGTIAVANPNPNGAVYNNPNGQYQPAVSMPVNSGTNSYNQPIVSNLGPAANAPNPGVMTGNQNMPAQPAVQPSLTNNNNGYNQPSVSSQRQPANEGVMNNQNMPLQPAVEMPVNNMPMYNQPIPSNQGQPNAPDQGATLQPAVELPLTNGYNEHPPVINPDPNLESRSQMPNNQNAPPQLPLSANSDPNGFSQPPQAPNPGGQGANSIVNAPVNAGVVSQPDNNQPLASLVLDSSNLSALGAQPAIMISSFKDTDKKDKEKSKDEKKKEKKDKEKKKDKKKPKEEEEGDKPKVKEPFTNKNKKK